MSKIYTNLDQKYSGVVHLSIKDIIARLKKEKTLFIDCETSAKNFNADYETEQFLKKHEQAGKKVTKATEKSAINHAELVRNEMCLDPYRSEVALLQINTYIEDIYIIKCSLLSKVEYSSLMRAISNKLLIGHNLKFDLKVLLANSVDFNPGEVWDTMIGYKLIRTAEIVGFFRSTLERTVHYHTGIELKKGHATDNWSLEITPEMLTYAIEDVKYLPRIYSDQVTRLNDSTVYEVHNSYAGAIDAVTVIEMKFVKVLAYVELAGFPVDVETLATRQKELLKDIKKLEKPFVKADINPKSPKQLMQYLADEYPDVDIMSTSKGSLAHFTDLPLVEQLLSLKKALKEEQMINDYINEWVVEGRIHSSYNQIRAATGRMSSSNPNAQQIPRSLKDMIYLSTPKRPIIKADYPNIEARVMAVVANDPVLIELFKTKKDMHIVTAAAVARKKEQDVTKEERYRAKSVNFGFMYGMGAKTFTEYALMNYDIKYSISEAEELRSTFFSKYEGIKRLHNKHAMLLSENAEIMLRTLLGRRMMADKFTDSNNYPVQGSAADLIKLAATMIFERAQREGTDIRIINIVHDELVCDCSKKDLKKAKKVLQESMEKAADFVLALFHTDVEVEVK